MAMSDYLVRRVSQVRRLGLLRTGTLAADRIRQSTRRRVQGFKASLIADGLRTWQREVPPRQLIAPLAVHQDNDRPSWMSHAFDLLGSGPQSLNRAPLQCAPTPRCWQSQRDRVATLLPESYHCIDWQLDPTSGFRWSAAVWHDRIRYGDQPGVEVKWPWELARLQHLPAIAAGIEAAGEADRAAFAGEIRSQIIDFAAHNPVGFGVNWTCAMDVGIRAANLATAVDLAGAGGAVYDDDFLRLVSAVLRDHGRFLTRNLEWGLSLNSNHYLGDLAGLLYCGAYLHGGEADDWLTFAGREMVLQIQQQFHADGSNFEGSTCYHRLSSEMVLHCAALMLRTCDQDPDRAVSWWQGPCRAYHMPPSAPATPCEASPGGCPTPFNEAVRRRLLGMALFTRSITRRDGSIPQIGDNDSGRFMRLEYGADPARDLDDHLHLAHGLESLFVSDAGPLDGPVPAWFRTMAGSALLARPVGMPNPAAAGVRWPDFGLYIWNHGTLRVIMRCGSVGQNGNGGHGHSDQLSLTIDLDGRPLVIDPGTGVYTPQPEVRNQFRSASAHSGIVGDRNPDRWLGGRWGLFSMEDRSRGTVESCDQHGGVFTHAGFGKPVRRTVAFHDGDLDITDDLQAAGPQAYAQFILSPEVQATPVDGGIDLCWQDGTPAARIRTERATMTATEWSPRYGLVSPTQAIRFTPMDGMSCVSIHPA